MTSLVRFASVLGLIVLAVLAGGFFEFLEQARLRSGIVPPVRVENVEPAAKSETGSVPEIAADLDPAVVGAIDAAAPREPGGTTPSKGLARPAALDLDSFASETKPTAHRKTEQAAGEAAEEAGNRPEMSLLRVEPDGAALAAGRSAPGASIRLMTDDRVVGQTRANAAGEFVVLSSQPLATGNHRLRVSELTRTDDMDRSRASREVGLVSIPPPDRPQDLTAVLSRPNGPDTIVASPEPVRVASIEPEAAAVDASGERPDGAANGRKAGERAASERSDTPRKDRARPRIEAIEAENGRLYIAGAGERGRMMRLYLDERFVGQTRADGDGRFFLESQAEVTAERHRVRADMLAADGEVVARAAAPFERPDGDAFAARVAFDERPDAKDRSDNPGGETGPGDAPVAIAAVAPPPATNPERTGPTGTGTETGIEARNASQAALETVEGRVLIRRGDTLWALSRDAYGSGRDFTVIYLANGDQIADPDLIYPGQLFRVPTRMDGRDGGPAGSTG